MCINGKKLRESIIAARRGLLLVFQREQNFLIHTACGLVALIFGVLFRITTTEILILLLTISFVLAAEIANTGMEHFLDVIRPRISPAVGDIKDIMAGLVLLSALLSLLVGLGIFLPRFYSLFSPLFT